MGKSQGPSGGGADSHVLYIAHKAVISFINSVNGKQLFISLSNMNHLRAAVMLASGFWWVHVIWRKCSDPSKGKMSCGTTARLTQ